MPPKVAAGSSARGGAGGLRRHTSGIAEARRLRDAGLGPDPIRAELTSQGFQPGRIDKLLTKEPPSSKSWLRELRRRAGRPAERKGAGLAEVRRLHAEGLCQEAIRAELARRGFQPGRIDELLAKKPPSSQRWLRELRRRAGRPRKRSGARAKREVLKKHAKKKTRPASSARWLRELRRRAGEPDRRGSGTGYATLLTLHHAKNPAPEGQARMDTELTVLFLPIVDRPTGAPLTSAADALQQFLTPERLATDFVDWSCEYLLLHFIRWRTMPDGEAVALRRPVQPDRTISVAGARFALQRVICDAGENARAEDEVRFNRAPVWGSYWCMLKNRRPVLVPSKWKGRKGHERLEPFEEMRAGFADAMVRLHYKRRR